MACQGGRDLCRLLGGDKLHFHGGDFSSLYLCVNRVMRRNSDSGIMSGYWRPSLTSGARLFVTLWTLPLRIWGHKCVVPFMNCCGTVIASATTNCD